MPTRDAAPPAGPHDPRARLRHELLTPATVISGRAGMLRRIVSAAPCLSPGDRARMLFNVAVIEDAVQELCSVVDAFDAHAFDQSEAPHAESLPANAGPI